jgi:hypothetical protein
MSWIKDCWNKLKGAAPMEMVYVPAVQVPAGLNIPGAEQRIAADECYIELYVESCRLAEARKFASRFNGIVYSFVSLSREGEVNAELAAVSKPDKLTELDENSLDKVITVSKQMMSPVPWRGGSLGLQIGLFSVKSGNLLTPVLNYVTKVSSAAGGSFVGAVKPFLPLITEGMDLIAGQREDTAIEVAIDTDIALQAGGVHAIIAAPKGSIDLAKISMDENDRKLLLDGKPLNRGYFVLSIRPTLQKSDFGKIPELQEKYAAFQAAIRANKIKDAQDAFTVFRLATIASPDLISSDAQTLVQKAEQRLKVAFPGGGIAAPGAKPREIEELAAIGLYS